MVQSGGAISLDYMKSYLKYVYQYDGAGGGLLPATDLFVFLTATRFEFFTIVSEEARMR